MKNINLCSIQKLALSLFLLAFCPIPSSAQLVFSRFDFNQYPLTTASIGPDGIAIDPNAVTDGTGAYINANCASPKGIDLVIENEAGIFNQGSMGMRFSFQRDEAFATFFERGGTRFYVNGGLLFIQYETTRPNGQGQVRGPFATGLILPNDDLFREFSFSYSESNGFAVVQLDGDTIWSNDGPDGRPLFWGSAPDPLVGTIMDGNCMGKGVLNYAEFFIPQNETLLPIKFETFMVENQDESHLLTWTTQNILARENFVIERGGSEQAFAEIGKVEALQTSSSHTFNFIDQEPLEGENWYRIRGIDQEGIASFSPTIRKYFSLQTEAEVRVGPNPATTHLSIQCKNCKDFSAKLYTMDGRPVQLSQDKLSTETTMIHLGQLTSGWYSLVVQTGTGVICKKISILSSR